MRNFFIILLIILYPFSVYGMDDDKSLDDLALKKDIVKQKVSLKPSDIINLSKELIKQKSFKDAKILLSKPFNVFDLEIERLSLLAQIAVLEKNYDMAIDIYKLILDNEPDISGIRFKLAQLYLLEESWMSAEYHFRLAASDETLPNPVKGVIASSLYNIRQNKNWNFWFNFGAAPDDNINNGQVGEECILTAFGILCNDLVPPDEVVGINFAFGGNYDFKLSDKWRLRNEFVFYNSSYDDEIYDNLYLSYVFGGKYVYDEGDVFLGVTSSRRWLAHNPYNYTLGLKFDTSYDFSKTLSGALSLSYTPTFYDDYDDVLNGDVVNLSSRLFYAFQKSKYFILKSFFERDKTEDAAYTNNRFGFGIGFGMEIGNGFSLYLEPSIEYKLYDEERLFVKDLSFVSIKEKDLKRKYSLSLSNRKIDIWGFSPVVSYSYINNSSNVWQNEYKKSSLEITLNQSF